MMPPMKAQLFLVAALAATTLALSQFGCSKSSSSSSPTATPTPVGSPVSFATDVVPVFTSASCNSAGCHGVGNSPPVLAATTSAAYANIMATSGAVDVAEPANSTMVCSPLALPAGCQPQCSSDPFTSTSSPGYVTILTWIQQGALNN